MHVSKARSVTAPLIIAVLAPSQRAEWDAGRISFEREALIHLDALFRVALRFVRNRADAEDLVQDTLFKAYRSWGQYQQGTNAKGWLITILRHEFINAYRQNTRRWELLDAGAAASVERSVVPFVDGLEHDEIIRALDGLPLPHREVVVLRDVEDLQYSEIATLLGVPVGTVKSRLFRARQVLQEKLRPHWNRSLPTI